MQTIQITAPDITIGQIVANDFRTADVFKKHNIDFCCKGHRTISEACAEKDIDPTRLIVALEQCSTHNAGNDTDFDAMPLDHLTDHIVSRHHTYIKEHAPLLLGYLTKVNKVHGKNHPELNEVLEQFTDCYDELLHHMVKEENILFPTIRRMVSAQLASITIDKPFFFGAISNPIGMMKEEHATEGDRVTRITELTNNFTPPEDACTTYRVAYQKLREFIDDLYTHIHLENNVLFPKAVVLESEIVKI